MKHRALLAVAALILGGGFAQAAYGQASMESSRATSDPSEEKLDAIVRLTEAMGMNEMVKKAVIESFEEDASAEEEASILGPEVTELLKQEIVRRIDENEFTTQVIVPIFDRNFTEQEVLAMTEFFETKVGRKLIAGMQENGEVDSEAMMEDLTPEDQQALIEFYLAMGEKIEYLSGDDLREEIMMESMQYGQQVGLEVIQSLIEEGAFETEE